MSYSVIPIEKFKKEAKRLVKKYPSLKSELAALATTLAENPKLGTPLGNDAYKIRIPIKSKSSGKSGGARVITYLVSQEHEIYLLTIYDKAEFESVDDKSLRRIIHGIKKN